jgi:hypothetical protein
VCEFAQGDIIDSGMGQNLSPPVRGDMIDCPIDYPRKLGIKIV